MVKSLQQAKHRSGPDISASQSYTALMSLKELLCSCTLASHESQCPCYGSENRLESVLHC